MSSRFFPGCSSSVRRSWSEITFFSDFYVVLQMISMISIEVSTLTWLHSKTSFSNLRKGKFTQIRLNSNDCIFPSNIDAKTWFQLNFARKYDLSLDRCKFRWAGLYVSFLETMLNSIIRIIYFSFLFNVLKCVVFFGWQSFDQRNLVSWGKQ